MSVEATRWAFQQQLVKGTADRFVLVCLADCANDEGRYAYPSVATIARKTGLTERSVYNALRRLKDSGVIAPEGHRAKGVVSYRIAMPTPESPSGENARSLNDVHPTPESPSGVPLNDVHPTPERRSPKPSMNHQKNHQGTPTPPVVPLAVVAVEDPDVERICARMRDLVGQRAKKPAITEAWRRDARLMLTRDGRDIDEVLAVMEWAAEDGFWRAVVLSVPKLREKFDQLRLKMQRPALAVAAAGGAFNGARRPTNNRQQAIDNARALFEEAAAMEAAERGASS